MSTSKQNMIFQSTLLMRGATNQHDQPPYYFIISIHAPHARSDCTAMFFIRAITYFNPRSSCEERPGPSPSVSTMARFQSTLLMRGATEYGSCNNVTQEISIHAPHARSDFIIHRFSTAHDNFNPRSSYEERRHECAVREVRLHISIHAPHTRSDPRPILRTNCS